MPTKSRRSKRSGIEWKCPRCDRKLTLFVEVAIPPTCRNSSEHSQTTIKMEKETK